MWDLLLHVALLLKILRILMYIFFYVYGFTQFCAIFLLFSVDIHALLCKQSFILVHQTFAKFSRSFLWPMNLSLKTVMSIVRVGQPTLMKLIDQVIFVITFLSLFGSVIVTPAFVLQCPYFHWRVVIILPCLSFH